MFVSAKGFAFCTSDLDAGRSIDEKFENALIVSISFSLLVFLSPFFIFLFILLIYYSSF